MADRKRRQLASITPSPGPMPAPPPRTGRPVTPILPASTAGDLQGSEVPDFGTTTKPKFLRLQRKDTLIWPEQLERLTVLQRALNRKRPRGQGERITENTLIRLAIDLLLSRQAELAGASEDELRRSVLPDFGTSE